MPVAPLRIRILLLFPQKLILFILNNMMLMIRETTALKKTISTAGMCGSNLTNTFIKEKKKTASNIWKTPLDQYIPLN